MIANEPGQRFSFYEVKFTYRKDPRNSDCMADRIWVKTIFCILLKKSFPYNLKYPRIIFDQDIDSWVKELLPLGTPRKYTTERLTDPDQFQTHSSNKHNDT